MIERCEDSGDAIIVGQLKRRFPLPLVCLSCRQPPTSWRLDPETLRCSNPACEQRYGRFGDIPLVMQGDTGSVREHDWVGSVAAVEPLTVALDEAGPATPLWDGVLLSTSYVDSYFGRRTTDWERLFEELLPHVDGTIEQVLDVGCGVGAVSLEVARRTGALVVGMDTNPHSLRWAAQMSQRAPVALPRRLSEARYEVVTVSPAPPAPGRVAWLCADILFPPFEPESFDLVLAINLIDSVRDPYVALGQASALLRPGGYLILAQPDSWSAEIVSPSGWLADDDAGWDAALARFGLETRHRIDGIRWRLIRSPRVSFDYTLHARVARRGAWPEEKDSA